MRDHIYNSVCRTLADYLDVAPANVRPEQQLEGVWGLDRVQLSSIVDLLEEQQDVEIRNQDLDHVQTVGQLVALVRAIQRREQLALDVARKATPRRSARQRF